MRVRFIAQFDWRMHARHVRVYPAGWSGRVTRACGAAAVAAGAAVNITARKGTDDGEGTDQHRA